MEVTGPATVHDVEGVEIAIHTWNTERWMESITSWQMYGRLTAETAGYSSHLTNSLWKTNCCTPSSTKTLISTGDRCHES